MSLPNTPLLVAPSSMDNVFGAPMSSGDLIKGLRRINPNLCIPDPSNYVGWYPLKEMGGTCIWNGDPKYGRKVCAFGLGFIPEFTQSKPDGIVARGWRSIFEKCIKARVVTRFQVEQEFKVNLLYDGNDRVCIRCQEDGERVKIDSASNLCEAHDNAIKHRDVARERRKESAWLSSLSPDRMENRSPVTLDLGS